jgi:hypothetical protein
VLELPMTSLGLDLYPTIGTKAPEHFADFHAKMLPAAADFSQTVSSATD